jgi:hypothetical protein
MRSRAEAGVDVFGARAPGSDDLVCFAAAALRPRLVASHATRCAWHVTKVKDAGRYAVCCGSAQQMLVSHESAHARASAREVGIV